MKELDKKVPSGLVKTFVPMTLGVTALLPIACQPVDTKPVNLPPVTAPVSLTWPSPVFPTKEITPSPQPDLSDYPRDRPYRSTSSVTPYPTATPYSEADQIVLERSYMTEPETVPYIEPGDLVGRMDPNRMNYREKYPGAPIWVTDVGVVVKKNGQMVYVSEFVYNEYYRNNVIHRQDQTPDGNFLFAVTYHWKGDKKIFEVARWRRNEPSTTYMAAAKCDFANCNFSSRLPAVDSWGMYGVAIKNGRYIHIFEVGPHHQGTLWTAPEGWEINELTFGGGNEVEEDTVYLEMVQQDNHGKPIKHGLYRLRDGLAHHFPKNIIDDCAKCTNRATYRMMEYQQQDLKTGDWPQRPADKKPKLEAIFEGDGESYWNFPDHFYPVWKPSSSDGRDYLIYPTRVQPK